MHLKVALFAVGIALAGSAIAGPAPGNRSSTSSSAPSNADPCKSPIKGPNWTHPIVQYFFSLMDNGEPGLPLPTPGSPNPIQTPPGTLPGPGKCPVF